jgi:hypothetical protein
MSFYVLNIFRYKLAVQSDLRLLRDADRSDGSPLRSGERVGFATPFPLSTDPPVSGAWTMSSVSASVRAPKTYKPIEAPCISKVEAGALTVTRRPRQ